MDVIAFGPSQKQPLVFHVILQNSIKKQADCHESDVCVNHFYLFVSQSADALAPNSSIFWLLRVFEMFSDDFRRAAEVTRPWVLVAVVNVYHCHGAVFGVVEELVAPQQTCSRIEPLSEKGKTILLKNSNGSDKC